MAWVAVRCWRSGNKVKTSWSLADQPVLRRYRFPTLTIISAAAYTASIDGRISRRRPYVGVVRKTAVLARRGLHQHAVSAPDQLLRTPAGVEGPTRFSLFLISFGMPIIIQKEVFKVCPSIYDIYAEYPKKSRSVFRHQVTIRTHRIRDGGANQTFSGSKLRDRRAISVSLLRYDSSRS